MTSYAEEYDADLGICVREGAWDRDVEWVGIDTTPSGYAATSSGLLVPAGMVMREKPLVALDLFAGCGGMSLGLEYAGIDVVAAVEWDIHAFMTYVTNLGSPRGGAVAYSTGKKEELDRLIAKTQKKRAGKIVTDIEIGDHGWWGHNRHNLRLPLRDGGCRAFFLGDIRECSGQLLLDIAGVDHFDVICGGPPCQGLSNANSKACIEDPRNAMLWEYMRMVEELRPRAFMIENVPPLLTVAKGGLFRALRQRAIGLGYNVVASILNAVDYGVPQNRRRCIIVGTLDGETSTQFQFPAPTNWAVGETVDGHSWNMLQDADAGDDGVTYDDAARTFVRKDGAPPTPDTTGDEQMPLLPRRKS